MRSFASGFFHLNEMNLIEVHLCCYLMLFIMHLSTLHSAHCFHSILSCFYFDLSLEWEEKKKHCSIKERMLGPIGRRPGFGS